MKWKEQYKQTIAEGSEIVAAGKFISFSVPSYGMISQIFLRFLSSTGAASTQANIMSSIENITIKANGDDILNISPANLLAVYQTLGLDAIINPASNVLPLLIGPLGYKLANIENLYALGRDRWLNGSPLTTLQVQVKCAGTITGVANVDLYTERFDKGTGKNLTFGFVKMLTYTQSMTSAGISTISTLPRATNEARIACFAIAGAGGVIASGEAIADNIPLIGKTPMDVMNQIINCRGYSNVAGVFPYMFSDGQPASAIDQASTNDFRLNTEFSAAPTSGIYPIIDMTAVSV